MPDAVMLFAAGFGTRMGDLTRTRPKPLIPVAGRALLDHALDLTTGIRTRVVNAHYHADQILAHLEGGDIRVSLEQPDILDTGGGLRHALPLLNANPVFTLNTDAIWSGPNPLDLLRRQWDATRMDALLLCIPQEQALGRDAPGDFSLTEAGQLIRQGDLVYTGAQIVKTDLLHDVPDPAFSLNVIWNRMAQTGRLHGLRYPGRWCDVGHPDGIVEAEGLLRDV